MGNEINTQGAAEAAEAADPVETAAIDDDVMLPDDYEEGKPYSFEEATETEESSGEDPTALPAGGEDPAAGDVNADPAAPAADQPGTGEDPAADPAAEAPAQASNTIKFTDTFQGMSREVELKIDQLPHMYRMAQTADFVTRRTNEHEGKARALGYKGVDDMLAKVRTAMIESEVAALMDDNVHEAVARDVVNRKYPEYVAPAQTQQRPAMPAAPAQPAQPARNLYNELGELFGSYPALRGQKIPQEVTDAAKGGKTLLNAYRDYLEQQRNEEAARLRKENATLKQNAAAAAKAPVRSVTEGGATDTKSEDTFLKGFNSGY